MVVPGAITAHAHTQYNVQEVVVYERGYTLGNSPKNCQQLIDL